MTRRKARMHYLKNISKISTTEASCRVQREVVSDSPGVVDFAIRPVNSVLNS